jgi:HAD domain in Swiss Army Knife RNA repair proteins
MGGMSTDRAWRPLLLLDVDGVLCPMGDRGGEELLTVPDHHVTYASATPERLARLGKEFHLVWATGWEHHANEVLAPVFGLPPLPYIRFEEDAAPHEGWKLPSIRRYVGHRPFAWVDNDISAEAHRWAEERVAPTLLLDIRADCGLAETDVERLLAFAAESREF